MNAFDRYTNLVLIKELRNMEKMSLDSYIEKVIIPLNNKNPTFIKTLYKDINYILDGIKRVGENDIEFRDGDFVIEEGDIKFTGYQNRLYDIMNWLHMQILNDIGRQVENPNQILNALENFNTKYLTSENYTPEYKADLEKIKLSLRVERANNFDDK